MLASIYTRLFTIIHDSLRLLLNQLLSVLSEANKISSSDYDNVQIEDVEEDEEDDDSIEDYERGAVAATGEDDVERKQSFGEVLQDQSWS